MRQASKNWYADSSIVNVSSCTLVLLPVMLQSEDQLLHSHVAH